MEDKEGFVRAPSTALAEFGGSRYDWLREGTLTYYTGRGGEEFVDLKARDGSTDLRKPSANGGGR